MTEGKQGEVGEQGERARLTASEVSWALRGVTRAASEVEHELARRLGLRPLDYTAMAHLIASAHPVGPAELGERVGISSGSATELVDRLVRSGHVVRTQHPSDRRRVGLRPTDDAVAQLLQALHPLLVAMDQLAAEFSSTERSTIQRYLHAVEQQFDRYTHPESPSR